MKLRSLQYRCFPLYVPLIASYEEVVTRMIDGKRKNVIEDLQVIDAEREKIGNSVQRVVDYLNYYEATQLEGPGADVEKYHQTREKLRRNKPPARSDRISKYLDEIEREFSGSETP